MKSSLLHGRSGALIRNTRNTRTTLRLSSLMLMVALSAPAWADTDTPAVRSTDVQTVAAANSTSVLAGLDNPALPSTLGLMPSGEAPLATLPAGKSSRIQKVLKGALALLGTPYRWGGTTTSGFDCSGLVGYVFRTALGIELPRVSREMASQASNELIKDRSALVAGDLVFFGRRGRVDHVGIYVGEGRFLHAPSTGGTVRLDHLEGPYWRDHYTGAKRVLR